MSRNAQAFFDEASTLLFVFHHQDAHHGTLLYISSTIGVNSARRS
jgi:hypothetical protein